jgi:hypothetical protein
MFSSKRSTTLNAKRLVFYPHLGNPRFACWRGTRPDILQSGRLRGQISMAGQISVVHNSGKAVKASLKLHSFECLK